MPSNKLNDLDPKSWLKFQKSWFIHNPPPRKKGVLVHPAKFPETLAQEFEDLYLEHCQLVYRTAYAITGNRQDAEDVLQRIFVKLLERGLEADVLQHPAGYLHRAAVNLSLNVVRERKRRTPVEGLDVLQIPAPADTRGEARDREHDREHRHERLMAAMAGLKPRALEILVMHYKLGYSDKQIAALLGTSRGVVAVTLYRIRRRLRTLLRSAFAEATTSARATADKPADKSAGSEGDTK